MILFDIVCFVIIFVIGFFDSVWKCYCSMHRNKLNIHMSLIFILPFEKVACFLFCIIYKKHLTYERWFLQINVFILTHIHSIWIRGCDVISDCVQSDQSYWSRQIFYCYHFFIRLTAPVINALKYNQWTGAKVKILQDSSDWLDTRAGHS